MKPSPRRAGSGIEPEHSSVERYGGIAQALHWATAILVLIAFIYGPGGSEQRVYSAARDFDRQLHETLGLTVLTLVALRLLWRAVDTRLDPHVPGWMNVLSRVTHVVLYILLFAVPFTAITGAWFEGHPLTLLGRIEIAPALPLAHDTGATIARIHTWLGDTILWLAGFHALAALFHQFVLRDDVLASMLPRWIPLQRGKTK
ncbi:MAG TPA: cytochrome b [Casimicrobiaceae bacterium]|nr:cytochrome b [Casimicrobiaceae bacterium]